jgi:hypothetical protein
LSNDDPQGGRQVACALTPCAVGPTTLAAVIVPVIVADVAAGQAG